MMMSAAFQARRATRPASVGLGAKPAAGLASRLSTCPVVLLTTALSRFMPSDVCTNEYCAGGGVAIGLYRLSPGLLRLSAISSARKS